MKYTLYNGAIYQQFSILFQSIRYKEQHDEKNRKESNKILIENERRSKLFMLSGYYKN